ncbi:MULTISPECIES: RNA polymerase-binding protein RbpA [Streptacidiphilus]|uniref:RNA polymerase-binding protein RbpA n=2 Tax=Streptacidiphilus TaxID=228398 RepID=A0ABV6UMH2_9ACTN|nr:RNA polymerase-binding protein RbpA [Streptacidiphilus jeojiense]
MAGRGGIRGSQVGAGPMGENERGELAPRTVVSFWCGNGHEVRIGFALGADHPDVWDCPKCGLVAGRDRDNLPVPAGTAPYMTHLGYLRQRRSQEEGDILLEEALAKLRGSI